MVQTSKIGPGPPCVQTGPLEWDPDPPYGVWVAHNGVPGFQDRTYSGHDRDPGGVWCRHVSRPDLVITYTPAPRSGGGPMLPRGILHAA
jgi:hypothetical protein